MISDINRKFFRLSMTKLKKDTDIDMSGCCPLCGDTKNRLHLFDPGDTDGIIKCFNGGCDAEIGMSLYNFLKMNNSSYLNQYKQATFKKTIQNLKETESLKDIMDSVKKKTQKESQESQKEIPLTKLFGKAKDNEECLRYLKERKITPSDDWYFSKEKFFEYQGKSYYLLDYLLIPIYNQDHKYRGFYSRSIHEKRFSTFLLPDTEKIWLKNPDKIPEIITEGIFDALSTGFLNPGAMLGASLSQEYIKTLPKNVIIATDNDPTGIKKALGFLDKGFKVFVWPDVKEKDFNEMLQIGYTKTYIKQFILDNTQEGVMGKIKLGIKEK